MHSTTKDPLYSLPGYLRDLYIRISEGGWIGPHRGGRTREAEVDACDDPGLPGSGAHNLGNPRTDVGTKVTSDRGVGGWEVCAPKY